MTIIQLLHCQIFLDGSVGVITFDYPEKLSELQARKLLFSPVKITDCRQDPK
jgi:hypothetical protein